MKTYYVTSKETHRRCVELFDEDGSHYLDLPGGGILVMGSFRDDVHEAAFAQQADVAPLPHPNSGETMAQHPELLGKLAPLGVVATHSMWDISKILGALHPHMGGRT